MIGVMGRYIVTGAAGFIGSHLTDRLLEDGNEVVGIDSFEDYYPRPLKEANIERARDFEKFSLVERNILDFGPGELADVVDGSECIFHLAAQAGVRASWSSNFRIYTDNNVLGTQVVLEACRSVDDAKLVYASSSSVYGNRCELPLREDADCRPHSPYGVTKLAGEDLCKLYMDNFGTHTVSLRFFTVYGPRQRPDMAFNKFIRAALAGRSILVNGDGRQTRDFTYVDDIVSGILRGAAAPAGSVVNLGGGKRLSLLEAVREIERAAGTSVQVSFQDRQAGDVMDTWADISSARALLDWRPRQNMRDGLLDEVNWIAAVQRLDDGAIA